MNFLLILLIFTACDQRFARYEKNNQTLVAHNPLDLVNKRWSNFAELSEVETVQRLVSEGELSWSNIELDDLLSIPTSYLTNPIICEKIGQFYLYQGDFIKALDFNQKAEILGARNADLYCDKSLIYMKLDQYDLALDYINKAVEINGRDAALYRSKGEVYMELGDTTSAIQYLLKSYSFDSSKLDVAYELAEIYMNEKDYSSSQHYIDYLLVENHRIEEVGIMKAEVLNGLNREDEAKKILVDLLSSGFEKAGSYLFSTYKKERNYDSVVFVSNEMLLIDSLNVVALNQKAWAFGLKGYHTSALQYYDQSLKIDSVNEEAINGLAKVRGKIAYLRKIKERREAVPEFDLVAPAQLKIENE